jgi:PleD family two-component response regulator
MPVIVQLRDTVCASGGFALQAHQDTLRGMMRQLEDLVATDELTGLFNRRHFLRLASRELNAMDADVCMVWR